MSSRENILTAITNNKPAKVSLPSIEIQQVTNYDNLVAKFTATLESIGGKVFELQNLQQLGSEINNERKSGDLILNTISESEKGEVQGNQTATFLEPVYKAYIKGTIGVAENGAVWIKESQMINRLLPFICQHLVIVLEKEKIVATMHHAYQKINAFEEGFGVFIAGPSKTADIEQSLVIGAHGARSLTLYLLN
ncbi:MAG: LUD domain-containing protein [Bacteroidota bacterium]